jgi:hypothetical protein
MCMFPVLLNVRRSDVHDPHHSAAYQGPWLSRQPRNRTLPHSVAASQFGERSTFRAPLAGLLLRLGQFGFAAHALPALLRPAAALGGAGSDKIALHVREAAENGNHQAPGAGAGVGPRLGKRTELRLRVHVLLDDGEQVEGAARQAVNAGHRHHVAGGDGVQHFEKLVAVAVCARDLLAINPAASRAAKLLRLVVERLSVDADAEQPRGNYNVEKARWIM